jgi:hypothetical protein
MFGISGASFGRLEPSDNGELYGEWRSSAGRLTAEFAFTAAHPLD